MGSTTDQSKKRIFSLWENPLRYVWSYWIFQNLPLMWKVKVATVHLNSVLLKRKLLDKYLGPRTVKITKVITAWETIELQHGEYKLRDVTYLLKRRYSLLFFQRSILGTQHCDENTIPFKYGDHLNIARGLDEANRLIIELNKRITRSNEHAALRNQIVNYKFEDK